MRQSNLVAALLGAGVLAGSASAATTTIGFETADSVPLPYAESGLTFSNVIATPVHLTAVTGGGLWASGSGGTAPYHIRAASGTPFRLASLDIEMQFHPWRLAASSGATLVLDGMQPLPRHVELPATAEWSNLTYIDVIHDYAGDRRHLIVDNLVVEFVPEPAGLGWMAAGVGALAAAGRRRMKEPPV
jgi:hypothetical protein